ncbi:hypothetical protein ACRRTK_017916 [Alexandromys fortis]
MCFGCVFLWFAFVVWQSNESDLSLQEPFTGKHKSADTVEKLVDSLVPSLLGGESFVPAFLYTYLKFTVIQNLLFLQ